MTDLFTPAIRRRLTYTLFAAHTLFMAAQIAAFTLMSIIGVQLSGSDATAGIPSTISMIGRALAGYPIGWLMDRWGRRAGLTFGYLLGVLGGVIALLAIGQASLVGFCLGVGLAGMTRGASEQTRFIAAEAELPDRRAKAIGFVVAGGTIAAVGGPLLVEPASALVTRYGLSLFTGPYLLSALLSLLSMVVVFGWLRPEPLQVGRAIESAYGVATHSKADEAHHNAGRTLLQVLVHPQVRLALTALLVSQFVMTFLMVIMPVHMNHHDLSTGAISWVISMHSLGMYVVSPFTGWLVDRVGRIKVVVLGALTLTLSALLTAVSPTFIPILAAMFLVGLGWNFAFIAGSSLLSDALSQHERGRIQGASETITALAGGVGSLTSGIIFSLGDAVGLSIIGTLASLLLLLAVLAWGRTETIMPVAQYES
ncbi:MAG: MFS transporter [Caldilineaceae bacterium]